MRFLRAIRDLCVLLSPVLGAGVGLTASLVLGLSWWKCVMVAFVAFLLVAAGLLLLVGPLLDNDDEAVPEAERGSPRRAFIELGSVNVLADQVAPLFWDKETWIERRVERIRFVDHTMVHRHISIDFRVPAQGLARGGVTYLPISVLRSWPPVLNFSLRDAAGQPLSLLSKQATNVLDERVLIDVAERAMGARAEEIRPYLRRIINDEGRGSRRAFTILRDAVEGSPMTASGIRSTTRS
jgi:hypothetical protein